MGFKRTSEGRVFFQGAEDSANDEQRQAQSREEDAAPRPLQQGGQQTQMQILGLLKTLNERLKITQAERNRMRIELDAYRSIIEDLETKAEKSERAFHDIEQKISTRGTGSEGRAAEAEKIARETMAELAETRKLILEIEGKADRADKNLSTLINVQKDHAQKMTGASTGYKMLAERLEQTEERQNEISGKIEETISQQARLVRKVDKAIEERTRFMRKIERIEETVIQMRDTLNARAMVLLTDQNPGVQTVTDTSAPQALPQPVQTSEKQPFWRRNYQVRAAGVIPLVLVVAAAALLVTKGERAPETGRISIEQTVREQLGLNAPAQPAATVPIQEKILAAPRPQESWRVNEDTQAFAPPESEAAPEETPAPVTETPVTDLPPATAAPQPAPDPSDDIGTLDLRNEAEVLALLESDPDALATALNAIEPGSQQPMAPAPLEPRKASSAISAPKAPTRDLKSAKPDTGLPASIAEIEKQAFEGVSEAQHDLAAIYTAGHGGTKQSYEKAAFWFRHAAGNGVPNAAYNLGVLYHQGLGVAQDTPEALRWYKVAADKGHPEAQYNLGIAFIEGIGVPYDAPRAAEYFENAADAGVMEAAYNLGLIYENGLLGKSQPDMALMWYKDAADHGSPEAKAALEQLAKTMNISLDDVNRAAEAARASRGAPTKEPVASGKTSAVAPPANTKAAETSVVRTSPPPAQAPVAETAIADPAQEALTLQKQQQIVTAQIQEYLMRIGLYPGPADGTRGPLTEDAIRSYQAINKMPVDGQATSGLLTHMLANADDAASASDFSNLN